MVSSITIKVPFSIREKSEVTAVRERERAGPQEILPRAPRIRSLPWARGRVTTDGRYADMLRRRGTKKTV